MTDDFTIVLRGYDMPAVDRVLAQADEALASGSETARTAARTALETVAFTVELRGYDRDAVDSAVEARLVRLGGTPRPVARRQTFRVVLRGYDRGEVDRLLAIADQATPPTSETVRTALANASFSRRVRGYDRDQVDQEVARRLQELG